MADGVSTQPRQLQKATAERGRSHFPLDGNGKSVQSRRLTTLCNCLDGHHFPSSGAGAGLGVGGPQLWDTSTLTGGGTGSPRRRRWRRSSSAMAL